MVLNDLGPPSSPPTAGFRRSIKIIMAKKASIQKMVTENPKLWNGNNNVSALCKSNLDIEGISSLLGTYIRTYFFLLQLV